MESNSKELLKKTAIITIGNISTKLINFLLLPFYTYILTTEQYGTYDLLHTYIFLLVPILSLQLNYAAFKYLVEVRNEGADYRQTVSTTTLFMLLQVVVYGLIFAAVILIFDYVYLKYLALWIIATVVLYDTQQMVRGINKTGLYAAAGVLSSALMIVLNIVFLTVFDMRVAGLLLAGGISSAVAALVLWLFSGLHKYVDIKMFSYSHLKKMLKFSLPLVPEELAWWVIHASDRSIVTFLLGVAQNGIIAVSQKFSSVYITLYNIFNLSWNESVILNFKSEKGRAYIAKTINTVTALFASLGIGIVAVMPFIFPFFVNIEYAQAYNLIPIYMLAAVADVYLGMYGAVLIAKEKTKFVALCTVLAGVINVAVHIVLIKLIGIYAAPISSVIAYVTILVIRYVAVKKDIGKSLDFKKHATLTAAFIVTSVCYYVNNLYLCAAVLVADIIICFYINKGSLASFKDMIFSKFKRKGGN